MHLMYMKPMSRLFILIRSLAVVLALATMCPDAVIAQQEARPSQPGISLRQSAPIKVTRAGQVIENVAIIAEGTRPAIEVAGFPDVVIRNVSIRHSIGPGISATAADRLILENVRIDNTAAPPHGPHAGPHAADRNNIVITGGKDLRATGLFLSRGSSGIYLFKAVRPQIRELEGFDFRGPFPRGQLVQFNQCVDPLLDTFSVVNPGNTAWTEDVVSSYDSTDPVIRNGYIEGVNSPTGDGVMIEKGSGGTVENVDVRYWVNGAFAAADQAHDVTFRNVRAYDGIAPEAVSASAGTAGADGAGVPTLEQWEGANYRGPPSSGQEAFIAYGAHRGTIDFIDASYRNLPRRDRVAWDQSLMRQHGFGPTQLPPRIPFRMSGP